MAENKLHRLITNQIAGRQIVKTVETDKMSIKGHLLYLGDVVIQTGNISAISISDVTATADMNLCTLLVGLFGSVLLLSGMSVLLVSIVFAPYCVSAGIMITIIGGCMMYCAIRTLDKIKPDKAINLHMNSGNVYSIMFKEDAVMDKVLNVLTDTFAIGWGNVMIDKLMEKGEIHENYYQINDFTGNTFTGSSQAVHHAATGN